MLSKEKLPGLDLTIFHPPSELTVSCESLNSSARGIRQIIAGRLRFGFGFFLRCVLVRRGSNGSRRWRRRSFKHAGHRARAGLAGGSGVHREEPDHALADAGLFENCFVVQDHRDPGSDYFHRNEKNREADNQAEQTAQDWNEDERREDDHGDDDFRRSEHHEIYDSPGESLAVYVALVHGRAGVPAAIGARNPLPEWEGEPGTESWPWVGAYAGAP